MLGQMVNKQQRSHPDQRTASLPPGLQAQSCCCAFIRPGALSCPPQQCRRLPMTCLPRSGAVQVPLITRPPPRHFHQVPHNHMCMNKTATGQVSRYRLPALLGERPQQQELLHHICTSQGTVPPAAMRTMIWMAVSLKYRPSPETTRVQSAAAQSWVSGLTAAYDERQAQQRETDAAPFRSASGRALKVA